MPGVFSPSGDAGQLAVDHAVVARGSPGTWRCRACLSSMYLVRSRVTLRRGVLGQVVVVDLEDVRRVAAGGQGGQLVEVALVGLPGLLERDVRVLLGVERERLLGQLGAGVAAPPEDGQLDRAVRVGGGRRRRRRRRRRRAAAARRAPAASRPAAATVRWWRAGRARRVGVRVAGAWRSLLDVGGDRVRGRSRAASPGSAVAMRTRAASSRG